VTTDPVIIRSLLAGLLGLAAGGAGIARLLSWAHAWLWLAAAVPVWLFMVGVLRWVRRSEGQTSPLGLATALTLARAWMIAALAGFVLVPPRSGVLAWMPAVLYTTAALFDLVDGYVARKLRQESVVGARLDVITDALGLIIGPLAAIALGRLPPWYLLVGATYYLFHFSLWWRQWRGLPSFPHLVKRSLYTRMYAGYQMGLVATTLFPVLGPPGTTIAATMFMVPPLALFLRDYLVTTGRLESDSPGLQRVLDGIDAIARAALPFVRVAAAAGTIGLVARGQLPAPLLVLAVLLILGVGTRVVAFGAAIALTLLLARDTSTLVLAIYVITLVALLGGGGRAQLWNAEERWMLSRAGGGPAPR
jgi:CDP-diacylglycerol---glycerol-3-phosphate 3-phosphatidyltransferase